MSIMLDTPPAVWTAPRETIESSNLAWLIRTAGAPDYRALHTWSDRERERFWQTVIERIEIRFRKPWRQMLDLSDGPERARWLVGAEWNIAESCFQAPPRSPAIVFQREDRPLQTITVEELDALSNRVANAFRNRGLQPGEAVAFVLPMTPEAVAAYLGVVKAGAAAVGIADSFSAEEIATRLRIGRARWVLTQQAIVRGHRRHALYDRM